MNSKIEAIRSLKGKPLRVLTATDYVMARLLDEAGTPLILVGDSLGMVSLGYPDTTHVTMEDMMHHLKAVMRAKPKAAVVVDLPYRSYENPKQAVENARRLMETGVDAVKVEGAVLKVVEALVGEGIPVMGHLGMLPQSVQQLGGYKIQGKSEADQKRLIQEAQDLEKSGVFAIVLELVTPSLAAEMTDHVSVPTIGIGSGEECDGQVLVTHDLLGFYPWFQPKHVTPLENIAEKISVAVKGFLHGSA